MKVFSILLLGMQDNNDPPPLPLSSSLLSNRRRLAAEVEICPIFWKKRETGKKIDFHKNTILFQLNNLLQRLIL